MEEESRDGCGDVRLCSVMLMKYPGRWPGPAGAERSGGGRSAVGGSMTSWGLGPGDGSSRRQVSPGGKPCQVPGGIICLRRSCHFGPPRAAAGPKRHHSIAIGPSGVWRVPRRPGVSRPAAPPGLPTPHRPPAAPQEATARPPGPNRRRSRRGPPRIPQAPAAPQPPRRWQPDPGTARLLPAAIRPPP